MSRCKSSTLKRGLQVGNLDVRSPIGVLSLLEQVESHEAFSQTNYGSHLISDVISKEVRSTIAMVMLLLLVWTSS